MKLASLFAFLVVACVAQNTYPVPIPAGGRNDVHGWLILPFQDQVAVDPLTNKSNPIRGWFYHHVSEFPEQSPHNFLLMVLGTISSLPHAGGEVAPLAFPLPPVIPPFGIEWTFTPPPAFSLNDLLAGTLTRLNGVVYDGSFDTAYERIPYNVATLEIAGLPTAEWLNSSAALIPFKNLQFLSYPFIERKPGGADPVKTPFVDFYMAHELYAPTTDYDQIVWVRLDLDQCTCECVETGCDCPTSDDSYSDWFHTISKGGLRWIFPDFPNYPGLKVGSDSLVAYAENTQGQKITCGSLVVKEEMHCMHGPLFNYHCGFNS